MSETARDLCFEPRTSYSHTNTSLTWRLHAFWSQPLSTTAPNHFCQSVNANLHVRARVRQTQRLHIKAALLGEYSKDLLESCARFKIEPHACQKITSTINLRRSLQDAGYDLSHVRQAKGGAHFIKTHACCVLNCAGGRASWQLRNSL